MIKFKVGDKAVVEHPNGEKYLVEIEELYIDPSNGAKMAQTTILDSPFTHPLTIGQCLLQPLFNKVESKDIVTETTVIVDELLRDNEKLMFENDSLRKDVKRLDNMLEIVTRQYKEIQESNSDLREQLKLYRKGIVN